MGIRSYLVHAGLWLMTVMGAWGQGKADSLYATGNYTKAINAYAAAASPLAQLQIARAYQALGNRGKALVQYENLLKNDSSAHIARYEYGKLLLQEKHYDRSREEFTLLTEMAPDNPQYHYYLGQVFINLEQPSSSLVAFKRAVARDSNHLKSLFQLAKYFTVKQERDQGLFYVDKGLAQSPNDVGFLNLKALILYNDAQFSKAIPLFQKLLELGEKKPHIYEKLAYSHYKEWEFQAAKENYGQLLKLQDSEAGHYYALAKVYRKNKQLDSAKAIITTGMDVQRPALAMGYMSLATIAREKGNISEALEYLRLGSNEDPNNEVLFFRWCTTLDRYSDDAETVLEQYTDFLKRFPKGYPFYISVAKRRIKELKEQIHFERPPEEQ